MFDHLKIIKKLSPSLLDVILAVGTLANARYATHAHLVTLTILLLTIAFLTLASSDVNNWCYVSDSFYLNFILLN